MTDRNISMGEYFKRRYRERRPELAFTAMRAEEVAPWQAALRERLWTMLGDLPAQTIPLDPLVIGRTDAGAYWREKVLISSEPDMAIPLYVLVPKDLKPGERRAGILACHGHGNGKDDVCGIDHAEDPRQTVINYHNYKYADQFARAGYVVVAPDWRGFGERRLGGCSNEQDSCDLLQNKALAFGLNMLGLNIWDARRCLDYLQARGEVDPERLGAAGLSYGGTMCLFTTALDLRVKAAVVSGYINRMGGYSIFDGHQCGLQVPTGFFKACEHDELGALVAPRPMCVESAVQDEIFPIEVTREAMKTITRAYEVSGAADKLLHVEFEGQHRWDGERSLPFMREHLPPVTG